MREEQLAGKVNLRARVEDVVEDQRNRTRERKKDAPPESKAEVKRGVRERRTEREACPSECQGSPGYTWDVDGSALSGCARRSAAGRVTTSLADFRESRRLKLLRERRLGK